ncbi:MAG TPA: methionyl-tRNA formyltransferase [Pyrinomonadaceae bacterium]|jgi:methionyl-tRNA formyltransferase|nr:methionyl-tRNA formyltransferase [Pyrinomonadaceae bacterium]
MSNARVIVFGYGELGVAAVEALVAQGAQVVGSVVPSNRTGPDVDIVRERAAGLGIPTLAQPPRKQIEPFLEQLRRLDPELILVWSYSMILPPSVLGVPPLGCVNLHGGLLPEYRGGHVMQWAIINGETETGMTMHYIDEGIDTGPVIARERFAIELRDDAVSVRLKLKDAGMRLIADWWPMIASGTAPRIPQDETRARYYRLRTAEDGLVHWPSANISIYNLVRALVRPWPGAFTFSRGRKVVLRRVLAVEAATAREACTPGLVRGVEQSGIRVATGDGELLICEAEVDGRVSDTGNLGELGISAGDILGG